MPSKTLELVNDAYTRVTMPNTTKAIFKIDQEFLDTSHSKNEALFRPHQVRSFGILIDDCINRYIEIVSASGG